MSKSIKPSVLAVLCGAVALLLSIASINVAHAQDAAVPAVAAPQAAVSAVAAPAPSDSLANPVDDPVEAISDLRAAKKQGWAFAIIAAVCMVAAGLGRAAVKWPSWPVLSWINTHKKVLIVTTGVSVTATAAFNALSLGGSWYASIGAAGAALLAYIQAAPSEAK